MIICENDSCKLNKLPIPYEEFIGGVFLINKEHFEQINGFSGEYWGWGYEDNDLLERMRTKDIPLDSFVDISFFGLQTTRCSPPFAATVLAK